MENLYSFIDHTNLSRKASWQDISRLCEEAISFGAASVMIPPSFVEEVHAQYGDRLVIGTVIGFPNGYHTTAAKVFEAQEAVHLGADEIDMVINNLHVQAGAWDKIQGEIRAVRSACPPPLVLKVIIEECLLTSEQIIRLTQICGQEQADFIKTSTGFAETGASLETVQLIMAHKSPQLQVKAAGGIRTYEQVLAFVEAGCSRIGASSALAAIKAHEETEKSRL